MKKTLVALFALSSIALADTLKPNQYGQYDFSTSDWEAMSFRINNEDCTGYKLTLGGTIDLSKDWEISISMTVRPSVGCNEWGTAVISTGANPMLATYAGNGFQMYVGVGGQVNYKGAGNQSGDVAIKDSKGTAVTLTADKTYTFSVSHYGNITKYSVYDSDKNLLGVAQHTNATWSGTVSVLSTGVGGTYGTFNNNMLANGWSLPSGYIIPEPATATLSLLALCGLTMRRRRK